MTVTLSPPRSLLGTTGHMLALGVFAPLFSLEYVASFTNTQLSRTVGFSLGEVHTGDTSAWIQQWRPKTRTHQTGTTLPPSEEFALEKET